MSRNKSLAILQKTYDDSYLKCSTAVFYESQGNEDEAMRCWRNALTEILDHHVSKLLPDYLPRTETEKALTDSLHQLELQCKERIDLLEVLRISRQDGPPQSRVDLQGIRQTEADELPDLPPTQPAGWIGQGTIPAVTYPELSRPALPPRPSAPKRTSSEKVNTRSKEVGGGRNHLQAQAPSLTPTSSSNRGSNSAEIRSPSPDKYTMRTTLRSAKASDKASKLTRKSNKVEGPGANKAATLAWSTLSSRDRLLRGLGVTPSNQEATPFNSGTHNVPEARKASTSSPLQWDMHTRRLVPAPQDTARAASEAVSMPRSSAESALGRPSALSVSAAYSALNSNTSQETALQDQKVSQIGRRKDAVSGLASSRPAPDERKGTSDTDDLTGSQNRTPDSFVRRKFGGDATIRPGKGAESNGLEHRKQTRRPEAQQPRRSRARSAASSDSSPKRDPDTRRVSKGKRREDVHEPRRPSMSSDESDAQMAPRAISAWEARKKTILRNLPPHVDETAAKQILNEIVVEGDEVHWADVAGLNIAKSALRETVVYPFLRPDLFMGLREPARGMLLFGPPGTGKTMLARAVATESRSTFFSISASSLTSKYLGESEKLVRALFSLAKELAPSIIFVDEIDSLLSQRSGSGEHEATRRLKTEFLIQWSDLQRAAAGRAVDGDKAQGDPNRVLVLAATNLPWAIDEAARRRFVRRQYIPLPEPETRSTQLRTLLGQQKHSLSEADIDALVTLTDGFSGSDITALAKDAAMGPLRSLGDALLHMNMEDIRPIQLTDFKASLVTIRPSVSRAGLKEYEEWAKEFGERGG